MAHQSALRALGCTGELPIHIQEATLGRRASQFYPDLIAAIRAADGGRNIDRWCSDIPLHRITCLKTSCKQVGMAEHVAPTISVFVIPDGFGVKLFSVACDDPQQEAFKNAHQSVLTALGRTGELPMHIQEASLGRRARLFHPDLIAAIRAADGGRNIERRCFDVASVTSGNLVGLRAIGIGSTKQKRLRACKAALALAAVYYTLRQMLSLIHI